MILTVLSACAPTRLWEPVGYGWQALRGHLHVLAEARPFQDWLNDPSTPRPLRDRLLLVEDIRGFASKALGLPDNRSYRSYADLKRPFAVWNLFAAPELSLQLDTWCFPVVGCISYRGYYDQAQARQFADRLAADGREVHVGGVPAYSTLGFTPDPVLNTFINLPDGELARLVFHELAHQVVYVDDDSMFNESFATAVEVAGVERWLATRDSATRERYATYAARRQDFLALLRAARSSLDALYRSEQPEGQKREGKHVLQCQLQKAYQNLRNGRWGGYSGYDRFFAKPPNNAQLAAVGTYDELVPGFLAMLREADPTAIKPLDLFFDRVKTLAKESRASRRAQLATMANLSPAATAATGATVGSDAGLNPGKPLFDPSSFCDVRTL
jgi:predicted aminopeptidase